MTTALPKRIGVSRAAKKVLDANVTEQTALAAAISGISAIEAGVLDGVTPGTISPSKAVVAGTAGNIGIVKATQLHIGASGSETQVTSSAAELNILDNATVTAAELNYNDIVTLGTGAPSKSVVLDASGNYIMPSAGIFGLSRGALAAAGSTAADAAVITQQVTAVTGSNGTLAVALPAAALTTGPLLVINTVATAGATIPVFPVNGGDDNINGLAEDLAFTMLPGEAAWFIPISATQWYVARINLLTLGTTSIPGKVILSDGAGVVAFATILTDAQSADIAIHIPDPGNMVDAYVAMSTAALTAAEVDVLQDVTPGTVANSKAVVAGTAGNIGIVKATQLHIGASGSETQVNATGAEINNACDVSSWGVTYTTAQAEVVAAGIKSIIFNQGTGNITATIADAANHAGWFSCKALAEPDGAHTLTLTAGTFNGTNNVATFADALDAIVIYFDHTGNGVVVSNTGSVTFT